MGHLNKILDLEVIFKLIIVINGWGISREIAFTWLSLDLTDDKLTLVHVMACCGAAKLSPEPVSTKISRPHIASLGNTELIYTGNWI